MFTLTPENQPPIAIAGDDQEVEEEALVTLDGSGSYDLDGDELQYQWQQNGGLEVSLDDPSKVTPTFKAPTVSAEREILTFQLVVNDGTAESEPAEVTVTVVKSAPKTSEITALLGDRNRPWGLDRDVYTFMGEQGDTVTITLQAKVGGKNNGGDRATLKLQDNMSEVRFFRINSGVLPNTISATLPATGPYLVTVAGQPRFYKGKRFLGEYTLTLEGTSGRLEAGSGSSAFANRSNPSAKPPRSHRMWNWLVNRFPGLKHHGK